MKKYEVLVHIFGTQKKIIVEASGPEEAGNKVSKMPLLEIVSKLTIGNVSRGYSAGPVNE